MIAQEKLIIGRIRKEVNDLNEVLKHDKQLTETERKFYKGRCYEAEVILSLFS